MRQTFFFIAAFFICTTASADMVEIKGEGFFNGTIESEDKDQVTFKDADGKVRTLARKDILFMERQTETPPAQKALLKAGQAIKKIAPDKSAATSPTAPAKIKVAPVQKKESSSGGADATGALRVMSKARESIRESNARVEQALREGNSEAEVKKDPKKGHFASL